MSGRADSPPAGTRNGPVPDSFDAGDTIAYGAVVSALRNGPYGARVVSTTVRASGASAFSMIGSSARLKLFATAGPSRAEPSWNVTASRSVNVQARPSDPTSHFVASPAAGPAGPRVTSPSKT